MLASNAIAMRPAAIGLAKAAIKAPPVTTSSPLETTILLTGSGLILRAPWSLSYCLFETRSVDREGTRSTIQEPPPEYAVALPQRRSETACNKEWRNRDCFWPVRPRSPGRATRLSAVPFTSHVPGACRLLLASCAAGAGHRSRHRSVAAASWMCPDCSPSAPMAQI